MKILSLALLLMASLAFVLGGCTDDQCSPVTPSVRATLPGGTESLAKGAWVQMATGSGQQWWMGERWTFAFTAHNDAEGNCTGQIQAYDRYWQLKFHLKVTHLDVVGNQAYMVGYGDLPPLVWWGPPTPPGPGWGIVLVTDNGQGSKAELPDQQSYFMTWPDSPAFQDMTDHLTTATIAGFKDYMKTNYGSQDADFIMETNMGNTVVRSR